MNRKGFVERLICAHENTIGLMEGNRRNIWIQQWCDDCGKRMRKL